MQSIKKLAGKKLLSVYPLTRNTGLLAGMVFSDDDPEIRSWGAFNTWMDLARDAGASKACSSICFSHISQRGKWCSPLLWSTLLRDVCVLCHTCIMFFFYKNFVMDNMMIILPLAKCQSQFINSWWFVTVMLNRSDIQQWTTTSPSTKHKYHTSGSGTIILPP